MRHHDIFLIVLAFLCETIGTVSGFGSSTFFVPVASLLENLRLVLALTAILHVLGNSAKIYLFWNASSLSNIIRLALPSIVLAGLGALLTSVINIQILKICLGVVLIAIGFVGWLGLPPLPRTVGVWVTALSGFLTGLVGTGGAVRAAALASMQLDKSTFVLLSSAIDFGGDLIRAVIYLVQGYMDWDQWFFLPFMAGAAIAGAWCGRRILEKISQPLFEKMIAVLIAISGLTLIAGALLFQTGG